jgi:putative ABC transport system permease protein
MLRVSYRNVTGRFWTLVLTALSVVLGTAFVAGSLVFTDSIDRALKQALNSGTEDTAAIVRGVEGVGSTAFGDGRVPLPLALGGDIEQVDGVSAAIAQLFGSAVIVGADGTAVRNGQAPAFGWAFYPTDPTIEIVDGRAPGAPDEIAVESTTLDRSGLSIGDATQLVAGTEPLDVTVVGEVRTETNFGATLVYLDPASAEAAFAPDGLVSAFTVLADGDPDQEQLAAAVAEVIPDDAEVITGDESRAEAEESLSTALGFVNTFLLVVAGVSLLVGAFIIFNVFSMLLARRTRELALLRAVGASSGQVLWAVVAEAAVVGLLGSLLGLGLGLLIALALQAFVGSLGFEIGASVPVNATTVLVTLVTGLVVTVVSAVLPAVRASRIAPVAALRDDVALPERQVRLRTAVGLVLAATGTVVLLVGLLADVPRAIYWVGAGVLVAFFGVAIAAPGLARPVVWLVTLPAVRLWGSIGRLARQNAVRNPRRTAATASALMIGTALVGAATIVASSVNASVSDAVENELTADYVLYGGQIGFFPTSVADEATEVDGVELVVPVRSLSLLVAPQGTDAAEVLAPGAGADGPVDVSGGQQPGVGADGAVELFAVAGGADAVSRVIDLTITEGDPAAGGDDSLSVNRTTADETDWAVGDTVIARAGVAEPREFTVTSIFEDSTVLPQAIVAEAVYESAVPEGQRGENQVFVLAEEGADLDAVRSGLTDVVQPYLIVSVLDAEEFTTTATQAINQILAFISALLGLSIIVALIGIVITLVLSVIERRREIGLLRAVGLSRRQLRRTVTLEGVATSVFGALLGIALGMVFGISLQRALAEDGLDVLDVPWLTLLVMLAAGALVGVLASAAPAWWASRQDILRAIATE